MIAEDKVTEIFCSVDEFFCNKSSVFEGGLIVYTSVTAKSFYSFQFVEFIFYALVRIEE